MEVGFFPGAFDLCHAGHMLALKEAADNCSFLIVGLHSNLNLDRKEKSVPIMSMEEREIILRGIKYVALIVPYDTESDLIAWVKKLKPSVYFIGEDWKGKEFSAQKTCEELKIKVHYVSRQHPYSSSELRKRICLKELSTLEN